jgi:hypothetical protein
MTRSRCPSPPPGARSSRAASAPSWTRSRARWAGASGVAESRQQQSFIGGGAWAPLLPGPAVGGVLSRLPPEASPAFRLAQNLDFDFEKCCSVSLSHVNVYACLVCGKYFQVSTTPTTLLQMHCWGGRQPGPFRSPSRRQQAPPARPPQGRGLTTHAYTHSLETDHHMFMKAENGKVGAALHMGRAGVLSGGVGPGGAEAARACCPGPPPPPGPAAQLPGALTSARAGCGGCTWAARVRAAGLPLPRPRLPPWPLPRRSTAPCTCAPCTRAGVLPAGQLRGGGPLAGRHPLRAQPHLHAGRGGGGGPGGRAAAMRGPEKAPAGGAACCEGACRGAPGGALALPLGAPQPMRRTHVPTPLTPPPRRDRRPPPGAAAWTAASTCRAWWG